MKTTKSVDKKISELEKEVTDLMGQRKKMFPDDRAPKAGDDNYGKWNDIQGKVKNRQSWTRQLKKGTMTLADLNGARKAEKTGGKKRGTRRTATPVDEKILGALKKGIAGIDGLTQNDTTKYAVFKFGKKNIALVGTARGVIRTHWYNKPDKLKTETSKSERAEHYINVKTQGDIDNAVKATQGLVDAKVKAQEAKEAEKKAKKATKKATKKDTKKSTKKTAKGDKKKVSKKNKKK